MAENPKESSKNGAGRAPENDRGGQRPLAYHGMESFDPESNPDAAISRPVADGGEWLEGGCALLDSAGRITGINEGLSLWLEQSASDLAGRNLWELLSFRCPEWSGDVVRCRDSSDVFAELKLRLQEDAGQGVQWFSLEVARYAGGCCMRLNSILPPLADLEEGAWNENLRSELAQRQMFVRLLRAEAQLKNLTERWPGVIFSQRSDLSFRFVSPKIEELTGLPVADWGVRPQLFWDVVHEGDAEELRHQFKQARQSGQPVTCTYRIRHVQTGRIAYVLEHRQANVSRGGLLLGYEGVWLDVTRQTIAETKLTSAAWKETLSVLTMGLAHDFGNVMAGIHALSESFLEQVGPGHEFNDGLTLIRKNTQQASQLVHRIIDLHQGKTGDRNYYNLNELATEVAELVRKVIPRRMQLAVELATEALPVYLDAVELRQVVMNLVLNAMDAMPQNGRLVLRVTGFSELPMLAHCQGSPPRPPAARLTVQDTGGGIKPRHLASIFDPFFTTKHADKGSGLGLYNTRLFAEKHRGAITVDSTEGVGSSFHIWLPQADFTEAEMEARQNVTDRPAPLLENDGKSF